MEKTVEPKKTSYELVREWYLAFDQEEFIASEPSLDPGNISEERLHLKLSLIAEEFIELIEAAYGKESGAILKLAWKKAQAADEGEKDLIEVADALADLDFVNNGAILEIGIPGDRVFAEVWRSNMSKLGDDGKPVISDGVTPAVYDGEVKPKGKLLKGPGYTEPDIKGALEGN